MDAGGVRLAPAAAVYPAANRVEPTQSGARAVATELPKDETVRAAGETPAVQVDVRGDKARDQMARERLLQDFIRNKALIDPKSREVIFQSVNTRTGEIIRQFPDDLTLKLRDYVSYMADQRGAAGAPDKRITKIA
jgi:hypothetical protein